MNTRLVVFVALCEFFYFTDGKAQNKINFSRFGEDNDDYTTGSSSAYSRCNNYQYRCKSGQCIPNESLCDGRPDCIDGSDETSAACSRSDPCNPLAFRCDYGACVDGDAVCNGIRDCADNSDETLPRCSSHNNYNNNNNGYNNNTSDVPCRRNQFKCDNGQCIGSTEVCDGTIDCLDKSDENVVTCGSFSCPQYVFRCSYGACIDNNLRCNGEVNCADGSDENPELCGNNNFPTVPTKRPPVNPPTRPTPTRPTPTRPTQTRPTSNACQIPAQPNNGEWKVDKSLCQSGRNCRLDDGVTTLPSGAQIVYECNNGFRLNDSTSVICKLDRKWSHIPQCVEIRCPPLNSNSLEATCTYDDNWASCDSSVKPSTIANLRCRNSYTQDTTDLTRRNSVKCNSRGEWEPKPIKCVSVCGVATIGKGTPLVVNGTRARTSDFPWHATLYLKVGYEKKFICGATIIRENLLATAAHCVYQENTRRTVEPEKLYLATGNIFRDYDYEGHDPNLVKKARVKRIFVVCNYLGEQGNFASDIALLQIETPFIFSAILLPVCLDTNSVSDQAALEVGNYGMVPGFGKTEKGDFSFVLQSITVPYVPLNTCKAHAKRHDSERYITIDKFCAGYTNGSSVCDGDSGGGLVFKTDDHYYLRGIVSTGIGVRKEGASRSCNSYSYSLYTRVSSHMEWIQDVILRLETNKPFHGCA